MVMHAYLVENFARAVRAILGAALGAALVLPCVPREANAFGPVDLEVGLKAGAGTNWTGQSPDPMGFGIGGRAGAAVHLPEGELYGGVNALYYFGSSGLERCGFCPKPAYSVSAHSFQYGAELGYGRKISIVTIRAQAGLGDYGMAGNAWYGNEAGTKNYFYLEPALVGLVSMGTFFVGADAGALLLFLGPSSPGGGIPDSPAEPAVKSNGAAFVAHGQIGISF
jgi:hypothetical protein